MTTQQPPTVINTQQNNQQQVLQAVQVPSEFDVICPCCWRRAETGIP
jgi:alkyl hydroperoxide reductase subunit AhpC